MGWRRTVAIVVASGVNACGLVTNLDDLRGDAAVADSSPPNDGAASSSIATTAVPELLFAYADSLGTATAGSNFTSRSSFAGNTIEDRIVTWGGSYQANATVTDAGSIVFACLH